MANNATTKTICPRCSGKGNVHGKPERSCDGWKGTGMVPVDDVPDGEDPRK